MESSLTEDLLKEWRFSAVRRGIALEIKDSGGTVWSLPYAYMQAVKAVPEELTLYFHRYRVRVRGANLRKLYEQLGFHGELELSVGEHGATGAVIREITVESLDEAK
jgi:hypothetical protein